MQSFGIPKRVLRYLKAFTKKAKKGNDLIS